MPGREWKAWVSKRDAAAAVAAAVVVAIAVGREGPERISMAEAATRLKRTAAAARRFLAPTGEHLDFLARIRVLRIGEEVSRRGVVESQVQVRKMLDSRLERRIAAAAAAVVAGVEKEGIGARFEESCSRSVVRVDTARVLCSRPPSRWATARWQCPCRIVAYPCGRADPDRESLRTWA
jgi:hypothetical protein